MAHDSDVARVAAALKAPGIRYRNFGNDPVRSAATPAGRAIRPFPLPSAAMDADAAAPAPEDTRPAAETACHAMPGLAELPTPEPAFIVPEVIALRPVPPAAVVPDARAGQFPSSVPPAYPEPAPPFSPAPAAFPELATPGLGPAPSEQWPTDRGAGSYRLLEALGMPGAAGHALPPASPWPVAMPQAAPRASTSTMQSLGRAVAGAQLPPGQPIAEPPAAAAAADGVGLPPFPGPLPAAMVTLPLAEVLRLIATGVSAAPSPFAALRVPGGATNSR